jgi:hypothetical protein
MYDIFLSHSSGDKDWVRDLAARIQAETFQGRHLRAWVDEAGLAAGQRLRPEIEEALGRSRFLGLVLTEASVTAQWVIHEWTHFHALHPEGDRIVPLLAAPLKERDVPILVKDLVYIDFRQPGDFERGFARLLERLRSSQAPTLGEVQQAVGRLLDAYQGEVPQGDALYEYLAGLDIGDIRTEGLALGAFDAIWEALERLSRPEAYARTLLAAECLAALIARSPLHNRVVQSARQRRGRSVRMAIIRAYSKLGEIAPEFVDAGALLRQAAALDDEPDEVLIAHLVRAAGKINDTEAGRALIEDLARAGPWSRRIAAHALAFVPEAAGPVYLLSVFEQLPKRRIERAPPSAGLQQRLAALSTDPDGGVRQAAAEARQVLQEAWPALVLPPAPPPALEANVPTPYAEGAPFSGRFHRGAEWLERRRPAGALTGVVIGIGDERLADALFYGASGLIIPEQGRLSHQCLRLRELGLPFAMLSRQAMEAIPDGAHVLVNGTSVQVGPGR